MHFPHLLLSLIATATAVDVRLHRGGGCSGDALVCANMNPDSCCGLYDNENYASVGFYGIPADWRLICQGMGTGSCANTIDGHTSSGENFVCLGAGGYSGARYFFNVRRRADGADGGCTVQRPDALLREDGSRYNLTDLDDGALRQLITTDGSLDIPEEFNVYKTD